MHSTCGFIKTVMLPSGGPCRVLGFSDCSITIKKAPNTGITSLFSCMGSTDVSKLLIGVLVKH